ncbi:MAG: VOC family protein [Planctomycetota bacterium]
MTDTPPASPLAGAAMVGFVATTDAGRCRAFYEGQLGFRVAADDDLALTLDAAGHPVRIQKLREHRPQTFTVLGWNVDDLDRVVAALEERGVRPRQYGFPFQDAQGIATFADGTRLIWLHDPDDNILSVAQMARPR